MGQTSHEVLIEADDMPIDLLAQALAAVGYEITINPQTKCLRITPIRMKTLKAHKKTDGKKSHR